jgi:hypothetical protein
VPPLIWLIISLGGAVVILTVCFFADAEERRLPQASMIAAVAVVVVSGLILVRFLDKPYENKSGSIKPTAMMRTLNVIEGEQPKGWGCPLQISGGSEDSAPWRLGHRSGPIPKVRHGWGRISSFRSSQGDRRATGREQCSAVSVARRESSMPVTGHVANAAHGSAARWSRDLIPRRTGSAREPVAEPTTPCGCGARFPGPLRRGVDGEWTTRATASSGCRPHQAASRRPTSRACRAILTGARDDSTSNRTGKRTIAYSAKATSAELGACAAARGGGA